MMPVSVPTPTVTPVQGQWNSVGPGQQPPVGTIPLHTVIDFILQKTYHDIVVLADLLPGKSDLDRKIDIAHFANRTRQLVIRLLTVVKWAGSVSKVMKCEVITQLLDQQGLLFVDTADKLHNLANQLVVQARLPNFSIPAAIDVLTTGSYPRLPNAIRDKIIPPDPITSLEKSITLKRIDEIICHRLAVTKIPLQIADINVGKGMVKLTVPGEFKAILTLMGQSDEIPWRLLKINISVEDKYIGAGKALVHHLQVEYVHELVQSRLITNERPLEDLYEVLHSFCLSLKIEVLEAQAHRLLRHRWGRLIQIDEYQPGNKVVLSYWRSSTSWADTMTISIHQRKKEGSIFLDVAHKPPLVLENVGLVEKASTIADLSLERLLGDTIVVRSYHKLHEVWQLLQKHIKNDSSYITDGHSCLVIPLAKSFQSCGNLYLSVDPQTGSYVCASTDLGPEVLTDVEQSINDSVMKLITWVPKLRYILAKKHCNAMLQNLPAFIIDKLRLTNFSSHPVGKLGGDVMYIQLAHFDNFYIVVQTIDDASNMLYKYYLLRVVQDSTDQRSSDWKADVLVEINSILCDEIDGIETGALRFQNSEMAAIVATCNARIPFIRLISDLTKEGLRHQDILSDASVGLCVKLLDLEGLPSGAITGKRSLVSNTLQCSFRYRLLEKASKSSDAVSMYVWFTEFIFANNPLKVDAKPSAVTRLMLKLDVPNSGSPVKAFKDNWTAINKLYKVVVEFADTLYTKEPSISQIVSVHSYDYQSLILKYGIRKTRTVSIGYSCQNECFNLQFGRLGSIGSNSHSYMSHYLTTMFNNDKDIGKLVRVLHDTSDPFHAACMISSFPVLGTAMGQHNTKSVCDNFMIIVQSPWRFLLVYRSIFAVEICCLPGRRVSVRDGALSKCDSSVIKEGLQPIVGLVNFLMMICKSAHYLGPVTVREDPPLLEQSSKVMNGMEIKTIPHGNWASNLPVSISHVDFIKLVKEQKGSVQSAPSFLEQFMGLTALKSDMLKCTRISDSYYFPKNVQSNPMPSEISGIDFAVNTLYVRCALLLNGERLELLLKLQQMPQYVLQDRNLQSHNWHTDNLRILEKFFQIRVATHPYRSNNMYSFCCIMASKPAAMLDFINIMQLELSNHQNNPTVRWIPQMCLTIPPKLQIASPFAPAVYIKDKILIVMLFSQKAASPQANRQSFLTPIVVHPNGVLNIPPGRNNPHYPRIDAMIKQYVESTKGAPNMQFPLASAVKHIMENYDTSPP